MPKGWSPWLRLNCSGHFCHMPDHAMQRSRPRDHLLIWVLGGRGWVRSEGHEQTVATGDLVALVAGRPHAYGADPHRPWDILWAHFQGHWAGRFMADIRRHAEHTWRVPLGLDDTLRDRWMELALCENLHTAAIQLRRDTALAALLGQIIYRLHLPPTASTTPTGLDVEKLQRFIHDHRHQSLSLAQLAAVARLSPAHFTRQFKRHFAVSPLRYVTQTRIAHAATLLTETNLPIKQISATVGYDDPYYFSRLFHKLTGTSPTDYRKNRAATPLQTPLSHPPR